MNGIPSVGHHPDREPSRVPEINNAPARTIVIDDGELLAKVLPPGGPLQSREAVTTTWVATWTCPVCGVRWRCGPPPECHDVPARDGCPVEPR